MQLYPINRRELWMALSALLVAIILQLTIWFLNTELTYGPHNIIVAVEIVLAVIIALGASRRHRFKTGIYRNITLILLGLISLGNIISFFSVARLLTFSDTIVSGRELLVAALAIFITNIIIFALWYWEIDSPGMSGSKWSKHDQDFQFTQQERPQDFPRWKPSFIDYMYLSITNGINFAPADCKPITGQAKALMGIQALLSVFTLALILARSVNILH